MCFIPFFITRSDIDQCPFSVLSKKSWCINNLQCYGLTDFLIPLLLWYLNCTLSWNKSWRMVWPILFFVWIAIKHRGHWNKTLTAKMIWNHIVVKSMSKCSMQVNIDLFIFLSCCCNIYLRRFASFSREICFFLIWWWWWLFSFRFGSNSFQDRFLENYVQRNVEHKGEAD